MISWAEDYETRMHPTLMTTLLHDAVPVLRFVDWRVLEIGEGDACTMLPLTAASSNQHGTHQAAILALAADYTGGLAVATLIRGVPIVGVHPGPTDEGAALWLGRLTVTYQAPAAADVTLRSHVPPERAERIRRRYAAGQQVVEEIEIHLEADGDTVATATLCYVLRQARALKPTAPLARLSPLYAHRVKASARLIAGLRAMEAASPRPLVIDPDASTAAGAHGRLLAARACGVLPQLRTMVASRTKDADDCMRACIADGARQIVVIGAGFNTRALRLVDGCSDVSIVELDLPHMLAERDRLLTRLGVASSIERIAVGIDLELEDVAHALLSSGRFDPAHPAVFVVEGVSMYLSPSVNERLFAALRRLLRHPASRVWVDVVARAVVEGATGHSALAAFVRGMEQLGEPFVSGVDDPAAYFDRLGYAAVRVAPSDVHVPLAERDPVFGFYRFCVLAGSPRWAPSGRSATPS